MKLRLLLVTLFALACLVAAPPHALAAKGKKKGTAMAKAGTPKEAPGEVMAAAMPAAPGGAKPGEKKGGGMDVMSSDSLPFDKMQADTINYLSSGEMVLVGKVSIKSEQMNLDCTNLNYNPQTKIAIADGAPVKMTSKQNGQDVNAECQQLTYFIDKKSYILKGKSFIIKKEQGKTVKINGEIITVNQDADGKSSMSVTRGQNAVSGQPTIEAVKADVKPGPKKSGPSKKVGANNLDMIKTPDLTN